jgi:hypothetical protein
MSAASSMTFARCLPQCVNANTDFMGNNIKYDENLNQTYLFRMTLSQAVHQFSDVDKIQTILALIVLI